jgi:hypothetical protein
MHEEDADVLQGRLGERSQRRSEVFGPAAPLAALALAIVSLIGISPAQLLAQSVFDHGHDFRALAVAPGVGAVACIISLWLGRLALRVPAVTSWQRAVAVAAMIVAVVALTINAAAVVGALTVGGVESFVSG